MKTRLFFIPAFICVALITILTGPAPADELTLKNGDRLTGTIVRMGNKNIVIKTTYGGEVSVNREEVSRLGTTGTLVFTMADGTVVKGNAFPAEEGEVGIRSEEAGEITVYSLAAIQGIRQPGVDPDNYLKGRLFAAASVADGNTDTKTYHFETEVVRRIGRKRLTVGASYDAASDQGHKTEENYEGRLKHDYFMSKKWYLYANLELAKDRFKDLNLRTFVGIGAGYQVWESEERNLALEGGLGYTKEDYDLAPDDEYPSARWALNYDRQLFDTAARFFHNHDLLVGLEDTEDLYLEARTGLSMPLYKNLSATAQVDFTWDNTPADGTERSDTLYRAGIDYTW